VNVLIVAPEYPPNVVGGGGAVYQAIAEFLTRRGHLVTVVCGDFRVRRPRVESVNGVEVRALPTLPAPSATPWLMPAMPPCPGAWPVFIRNVLRRPWDVAHLHGVGFPLVDVSAWLLRRRRLPYVFTSHSVPSAPFQRLLPGLLTGFYLQTATRATMAGAAVVTAVSKGIARDPHFPLPPATRIVYNGLADAAFARAAAAPHASPSLPLRAFSAGRVSRVKGFDVAIEAIGLLRREYGLVVEYDIWGEDGGDAADFRALAVRRHVADLVTFRGPFEPENRAAVFSSYGVLLVPSRSESFGLTALEAMALGIPVVASDCGGLPEVLGDVPALVPAEQPAALAAALARLAGDPSERERAGCAGRRRAESFRWGASLAAYEACLEEAARSRAASKAPP
jgi:glycosyltransferase involved in cell wall biosynthesis